MEQPRIPHHVHRHSPLENVKVKYGHFCPSVVKVLRDFHILQVGVEALLEDVEDVVLLKADKIVIVLFTSEECTLEMSSKGCVYSNQNSYS